MILRNLIGKEECSENDHFLNTFYFLEIREISFKFYVH